MSRQATDQLYIDLEYFTPEEYFVYVAEGEIYIGNFYIEPDYIEANYYADSPGGVFSLACDLTQAVGEVKEFEAALSTTATVNATVGVIKQASIAITSAFTPTMTVNAIRFVDCLMANTFSLSADTEVITSNESLLEFFAALNAQNDRKRAYDTALSASFDAAIETARTRDAESSLAVSASIACDATRTRDTSSTLNASFSITLNFIYEFAATLSSSCSLSAQAITYTLRPKLRPLVPTYDNLTYTNSVKKFGTYSAGVGQSTQKRLEYTTNAEIAVLDNSEEWFLEFFYFQSNGNRQDSMFVIDEVGNTNSNNALFTISSANTNDLFIFADAVDGTTNLIVGSDNNYVLPDATWHHLLILWSPVNGFKVYRDGAQIGAVAAFDLRVLSNPRISIGSWDPETADTEIQYFDELRIAKGPTVLDDYGYTFSNSTQTVPTSAFTNDVYTALLLHFENNSTDDATGYTSPPVAWYGLADLSSSATASATGDVSIGVIADLTTAVSLASTANYTAEGSAQLDSNSTLAVEADQFGQLAADLSAAFQQTAVTGKVIEGAADLSGAASFDLSADYIIINDAYLESQFSLTADVDKFTGIASSTLASSADFSADINVVYGLSASATAQAAISCDATVILSSVRSLVHFNTTSAGIPIDEFEDNEWSGTVDLFASGTNFNNFAKFGDGAWHNDDPNIDPSDIETRLLPRNRVTIGTQDFSIDFRLDPAGEFNSPNEFTPAYPIPVLRMFDSRNEFGSIIAPFSLLITPGQVLVFNPPGTGQIEWGMGNWGNTPLDFKHVAISRQIIGSNSIWRLFVDGDLKGSLTETGITDLTFSDPAVGYYQLGGYWDPNYTDRSWFGGGIDEFRLLIGTNPYTGNYTVPTVEYSTVFALATVEDMAVTSTVYCRPTFIVEYQSDQLAEVSLTATSNKFVGLISTTFETTASITVDADVIKRGVVDVSASASLSCDAVKTASGVADCAATATHSTSGARIRFADSDQSVQATLDLPYGEILRTPSADLVAAFAQSTVSDRIRDNVISTEAIASSLTAAVKVGDFLVDLDTNTTLTADVRVTTDTPIDLSAQATVDAIVYNVASGVADITALATLTATVDKIKKIESEMSVAFTVDSTAVKTTDVDSTQSFAFSAITNPYRVRYNQIALNIATTLTAQPQLILYGSADLSSEFTGVFNLKKIVRIEANLQGLYASITAGRAIHIDDYYQLIVPAETRYIKVLEETRTQVVDEETRELVI